jgi:hypothetical protein
MAARGGGPIVGLVLGSVLTAVGYGVTFWLGKPLREQAVASQAWPATDGRITRSVLEESRKDGKTHRSADIAYEYHLDGRTLTGSRVWIGDGYSASPGNEFRAAVDRYPVGRQVRVHYDPQDPAESVLEPGPTWSGSMLYLIGLGVLALGGLILLSAVAPLLVVLFAVGSRVTSPWPDESRLSHSNPAGTSPGDRGQPPRTGAGADDDDGISIR